MARKRRLGLACAVVATVVLACAGSYTLRAAEDAKEKGAAKTQEAKPAPRKLVAPKNWPAGHPLPEVASNCVACHLTAGRELTAAVEHFVRSVHDLNGLTCYDCHGGNRENDARAHEEDFGFIGTKISAHLKVCSECHTEEADRLAAGPHHWDFSKRVNTQYPTCVDCHGNHDVGNPPADFKLANMCLDCHHTLEKDFPHMASVVVHGDLLADVLRDVQKKNVAADDPIPEPMRKDLASLRTDTMQAIHGSKELTAEAAGKLNERTDKIRARLADWLKQNP